MSEPYTTRHETTIFRPVIITPYVPERLSDKKLTESREERKQRLSSNLPKKTYNDRLREGFNMLEPFD